MTRAEAFKIIRTKDEKGKAIACTITYCTLDESRGTGGEIRTVKNVVPAGANMNMERNLSFAVAKANGKDFRRGVPILPIKVPLLLRVNGELVI